MIRKPRREERTAGGFIDLSPPFGGACFFLKGVAPPDVTMEEIFATCWPWMGLQLIGLALVMAFPELARWLPREAR